MYLVRKRMAVRTFCIKFQYTEFTQEKAIGISMPRSIRVVDFGTVWGRLVL